MLTVLLAVIFKSGLRKLQPSDSVQVGDAVMQALLQMLSGSKAGGVQEDAFMALGTLIEGTLYPSILSRPNRPRFVLPILSHVATLLRCYHVLELFAFMAQVFVERLKLKKSRNVFIKRLII